jgi:putative nucleotidyltransferase with HDIG domain
MIKALVVDDREDNLFYLTSMLRGHGWVVDTARNGAEALRMARQDPPDIVVSDLLMPVMDGYSLLREWRDDETLQHTPFVVYTATYTEPEDEKLALDCGADAFVIKPAESGVFWDKLQDVLENAQAGALGAPNPPAVEPVTALSQYSRIVVRKLEERTRQLEEANRRLTRDIAERGAVDEELRRTLADKAQAMDGLQASTDRLRRAFEDTIEAMGRIVALRDPYTANHEIRVTRLAVAIAEHAGLAAETIEGVRLAGLVHDVGKVSVPAEILVKPGRLTETEFELVKTHPSAGFEILKTIDFDHPVALAVAQHHERLDGSGYPRGLRDAEILPEARILAVADVVEAMSSHRPYRAALGSRAALEEVRAGAGIRYDEGVVDSCERVFAGGFGFEGQ